MIDADAPDQGTIVTEVRIVDIRGVDFVEFVGEKWSGEMRLDLCGYSGTADGQLRVSAGAYSGLSFTFRKPEPEA